MGPQETSPNGLYISNERLVIHQVLSFFIVVISGNFIYIIFELMFKNIFKLTYFLRVSYLN